MSGTLKRLIFRNTVLLVGAQVLAAPMALGINAVAARKLGAADFGLLYLATTFGSLAFLIVEWGQSAALTAMVARDRPRAGELLGSGLSLRTFLLPIVVLLTLALAALSGYDRRFLGILTLVLLASTFGTIATACQDVVRGYERTEVTAGSLLGGQLLTALVVIPTLFLVGTLYSMLIAQALCAAVSAAVIWYLLPHLDVPRLTVRRSTTVDLFKAGSAFFLFNLVLALQPNVDAVFLSKLASPEAVGWQAVARKLTGILIFPSAALGSALFPTLSRLHTADYAAFREVAASALRTTPVIAMPLALGCVLFPQLGTDLFGHGAFDPAAANLRLLGPFVFLLYLTMPLSTTLLSAGRQRSWLIAQCGCVVLSAVLDPLLIPYFQATTGNGGLGVCLSALAGEIMMVAAGLWLLPRDIIARVEWQGLGWVAVAAVAMTAAARCLTGLNPYCAAVAALCAYAGCLWLTGGIKRTQLDMLVSLRKRAA